MDEYQPWTVTLGKWKIELLWVEFLVILALMAVAVGYQMLHSDPGLQCKLDCQGASMKDVGLNESGCYCQNSQGLMVKLYGKKT